MPQSVLTKAVHPYGVYNGGVSREDENTIVRASLIQHISCGDARKEKRQSFKASLSNTLSHIFKAFQVCCLSGLRGLWGRAVILANWIDTAFRHCHHYSVA